MVARNGSPETVPRFDSVGEYEATIPFAARLGENTMSVSFYPSPESERLLDADDLILKAMHLVCDNDPVFDSLQQARKQITNALTGLVRKENKEQVEYRARIR